MHDNWQRLGLHPFLTRFPFAFLRIRIRIIAMMHISSSASTMSAMPMPSTLSRPALEDRSSSGRFALTYRVQTLPDLYRQARIDGMSPEQKSCETSYQIHSCLLKGMSLSVCRA